MMNPLLRTFVGFSLQFYVGYMSGLSGVLHVTHSYVLYVAQLWSLSSEFGDCETEGGHLQIF